MGFSLTHLIVVLLVVFILFGAGKLPQVMGDIGKGIKSLKKELAADEPAVVKQVAKVNKKDSE